MQLKISSRGVRLTDIPIDLMSVDFLFDGSRVWSVDLRNIDAPKGHPVDLDWPEPLHPFLLGRSEVSVRDSASLETLAAVEHRFTASPGTVAVQDVHGNRLSINKWGRLGKTLDGVDEDFQDRITLRTQEIIDALSGMRLRPFVVGGTLLGGVREGTLLPHDDDADVAYLSELTNPADVALEGFKVGRKLEELGYHVVRHSATHMQLYFFTPEGDIDHYVDVFSAFFTDDGFLNQPFHVRGELTPEQMLPFGTVSIRGHEFPAPRDPEAWLVINYDENWRTPIPGYKLETPSGTVRRFQNWFGSYNFQRDFWNEFHTSSVTGSWHESGAWIQAALRQSRSRTVLDLGSGVGTEVARMAEEFPDRHVIGSDYSYSAMKLSEEIRMENLEFVHLNLYRLHALGTVKSLDIQGAFDLTLNHVLEQVGGRGRPVAWRLIRMALVSGGNAWATVNTRPAPDVHYHDPTGWHLTTEQLLSEAAQYGLVVTVEALKHQDRGQSSRMPVGLTFSIGNVTSQAKERGATMMERIKGALRRSLMSADANEIEALQSRVEELERDLDGYRRDSLRVAELLDLAEQAFALQTPPDHQ